MTEIGSMVTLKKNSYMSANHFPLKLARSNEVGSMVMKFFVRVGQ